MARAGVRGIPAGAMWIVAMGVASALHVGKLPPALPVLARELGVTLVQGGFLLSLIQLAGMTLGAILGQVADRLGPRRVMLAGLLVLAVASAAGALAPTPVWLLGTRAVEGVGFLMAVLPAPAPLVATTPVPPTPADATGEVTALGLALAVLGALVGGMIL
ncbi:MFS transporter, partial [Tepidimonas aquatica]|uniref:MFS transporter n=1 Tax=Tepidimonas aquatica TaxID=247482 RepID=UPI001FEBDD4C